MSNAQNVAEMLHGPLVGKLSEQRNDSASFLNMMPTFKTGRVFRDYSACLKGT